MGVAPEGKSNSVASNPTTRKATVGPVGLGGVPVALLYADNCDGA